MAFEILGMSQNELDAVITEKIVEPVPTGETQRRLMRAGQRVEVIENQLVVILDTLSFDNAAISSTVVM